VLVLLAAAVAVLAATTAPAARAPEAEAVPA
jgi:hypothetical protein